MISHNYAAIKNLESLNIIIQQTISCSIYLEEVTMVNYFDKQKLYLSNSVTRKNRQMSIKVAQK